MATARLWTGVPLGGVSGGRLGARLVPALGWPSLVCLGGAAGRDRYPRPVATLPRNRNVSGTTASATTAVSANTSA